MAILTFQLPRTVTSYLFFGAILSTTPTFAQEQVWGNQFGTPVNDQTNAVAPDGEGGYFTCGWSLGNLFGPSAGGLDAWAKRSDGAGNTVWDLQFGTSALDIAEAVVGDGLGGIFVGGRTNGNLAGPLQGQEDAFLARFDGSGQEVWSIQIGTGQADDLRYLTGDGLGGVIALGTTGGQLGATNFQNGDVWIARFDAAGNQVWLQQFGTSDFDYAYALVADGMGGAYCSGLTNGLIAGASMGSEADAWVARYDGAGARIWASQVGTNELESFDALIPDANGELYVGGWTTGDLAGTNTGSVGSPDLILARYDSTGTPIWIRQYGTSQSDRFFGGVPDGSGGLYLSGWTFGSLATANSTGSNALLAHFDPVTDQMTWVDQINTQGLARVHIASDQMGGVVLAGTTSLSVFGSLNGGEDSWAARYYGPGLGAVCDPGVVNSTQVPGTLVVSGNHMPSANRLTLTAGSLPPNVIGIFLASQTQGFVAGPGGSQGNLCLGGAIGRFNAPTQLQNSGANGRFALEVDLMAIPTPSGPTPVLSGQTWNFQAWHREQNVSLTSNFTHAVRVEFL